MCAVFMDLVRETYCVEESSTTHLDFNILIILSCSEVVKIEATDMIYFPFLGGFDFLVQEMRALQSSPHIAQKRIPRVSPTFLMSFSTGADVMWRLVFWMRTKTHAAALFVYALLP